MICRRFFIILFLIIAKGIYAPLLAEELHTQRKIQGAKEFSTPQGVYNKPLDLKNMIQPMPQPQSQKAVSSSPGREVKGGPSIQPIADGCNSEILKNLKKTYSDSGKELSWFINYVGFGILIAIFLMGRSFGVRNKCLVLSSSSFAILSLLLNYLGCAYLLITSGNILRDYNQNGLDSKYSEMGVRSECIYSAIHGFLLLAVILFCILGYHYFFKAEEKRRR